MQEFTDNQKVGKTTLNIRNSKTMKSVSVGVILWKLIQKQFKSVSVISGV